VLAKLGASRIGNHRWIENSMRRQYSPITDFEGI
jgi:hypothetical protein